MTAHPFVSAGPRWTTVARLSETRDVKTTVDELWRRPQTTKGFHLSASLGLERPRRERAREGLRGRERERGVEVGHLLRVLVLRFLGSLEAESCEETRLGAENLEKHTQPSVRRRRAELTSLN